MKAHLIRGNPSHQFNSHSSIPLEVEQMYITNFVLGLWVLVVPLYIKTYVYNVCTCISLETI